MKKMMTITIENKIKERLNPSVLKIINESDQHGSVPKGSESHFKIFVVSDIFQEIKNPLEKHRIVNDILKDELSLGYSNGGIHALSIIAKSPEQWNKMIEKGDDPFNILSPKCLGGSKFDKGKEKEKESKISTEINN